MSGQRSTYATSNGNEELAKYTNKKIPGYTGYTPGQKFGLARTPFPSQAVAEETVAHDTLRTDAEKKVYGMESPKKLVHPGHRSAQVPNLHPDDHDFHSCRPPTIHGNPSNNHNMIFGDHRIPGTYSGSTTNRETFKGPTCKLTIPGETPLTELYKTPSELKHAYERALARVGQQKVKGLLEAMSDRMNAKLGNNGVSAYNMRKKMEQLTGVSRDEIYIDDMRQLFMSIVGITLEETDLLALFAVYDADGSGTISLKELMSVLVDKDYFSFFLGNNNKLKEELSVITDKDRQSINKILKKVELFGTLRDAYIYFDANHDGKVSRAEFAFGCEKWACKLTPAALDMMMKKADSSNDGLMSYDEFCKVFSASYDDYLTGNVIQHATSNVSNVKSFMVREEETD